MDNFADRLAGAIRRTNCGVCVGLDPRVASLPPLLLEKARRGGVMAAAAVEEFCCVICDAVAGIAPVVKPQAAFFERLGPDGFRVLWGVMGYARSLGLLVILDAKRSDIGSTAQAYAEAYFDPPGDLVGPDAITVNAYLGSDGVLPFVEAASACGGGVFVLAKTSNPSSGELQDRILEGVPVYEFMGWLVAEWGSGLIGDCGYSSVGAVVGATYPRQLAEMRAQLPTVPFLVPGFGAQGGSAEDIAGAFDEQGLGAVVNSSRGIIFAYQEEPYAGQFGPEGYAQAARQATIDAGDAINAAIGR